MNLKIESCKIIYQKHREAFHLLLITPSQIYAEVVPMKAPVAYGPI